MRVIELVIEEWLGLAKKNYIKQSSIKIVSLGKTLLNKFVYIL